MLNITIYESTKAPFNSALSDGTVFDGTITVANNDDVDTLYSTLAQALHVSEDDVAGLQDLADDDVKTLLEAAKKANFILNYDMGNNKKYYSMTAGEVICEVHHLHAKTLESAKREASRKATVYQANWSWWGNTTLYYMTPEQADRCFSMSGDYWDWPSDDADQYAVAEHRLDSETGAWEPWEEC